MPTIPLNLESDTVLLPPPSLPSQFTLEEALKRRRSTRNFLPDELPLETLSALLWSASGVNRPQEGGRTAPSARNWQEIDVYVVTAEGAYRYEPEAHRLLLVKAQDLRAQTGMQDFVAEAPLDLVYVADLARMTDVSADDKPFLAGADAAFIAQNVYLYCAAAGLAAVVRAMIDRRQLAQSLDLPVNRRIMLAQTVGFARS